MNVDIIINPGNTIIFLTTSADFNYYVPLASFIITVYAITEHFQSVHTM